MRITIAFRDTYARSAQYYLRKRYNSKAELVALCRVAITREVAREAEKELKEAAKNGQE